MAALSPEIIAELKLEEAINSATVGEINGCPYLFLMTVNSTSGTETAATLRVLDVSDTSNPVEVVSIKAPIQILPPSGDVILVGDYIYSYLWSGPESILWILDVSNIPSITEVSCKEIQFPLLWPDISGDYMIARTAFPPYFAVYDISNPDNPGKITDFEVNRGDRSPQSGTQTVATAFSDSRFFVLEESGLTPFDMSSPSEPKQCSFYENKEWGSSPLETTEGTGETITTGAFSGNSFLDIGISGDHAFISAGDSGLVVLDVSDIEDIHEVARLELPYYTKKIEILDNYAFIMGLYIPEDTKAPYSFPIFIVDISQPDNPNLIQSLDGISGLPHLQFQSMAVFANQLYIFNYRTIHVIDLYTENNDLPK